jgi:hypothetical protein
MANEKYAGKLNGSGFLIMDNNADMFSGEEITRQLFDLIKPGQPLPELLINAAYLCDTWACAAIPHITGDTEFLHGVNMTEDQRFYFLLGHAGTLLDTEHVGRSIFTIIRQAYHTKTLMNRVPEPELLKEVWRLVEKFHKIKDEDAAKLDDIWDYPPDYGEHPTLMVDVLRAVNEECKGLYPME